MDIGEGISSTAQDHHDSNELMPFARPRLKRRRVSFVRPALVAVRPNPECFVLDLSESSKSIERRICNLVISDKRAVAIVGLPGCGKTAILRGLAYNTTLFNIFIDGICLIHLGPDVTIESAFDKLFDAMRRLDGEAQQQKIEVMLRRTQNYALCIEAITRFLKFKRILLILDNLSERSPKVLSILSVMTTIQPCRPTGRMTVLISTRSLGVARQFAGSSVLQVPLGASYGDASRDIFCAHSHLDRSYFDSVFTRTDSPALQTLQKCSGLPLALAVVGGAVRRLVQKESSDDAKLAMWFQYNMYLENKFDQFGKISGLFEKLRSCVEELSSDNVWKAIINIYDVIPSLSVFRKGIWIPFIILQRLWGMSSKDDTSHVVHSLAKFCLIRHESRNEKWGISIPEIVIEFCRHEAKQTRGIRVWHQQLLASFMGSSATAANGSAEVVNGTSKQERKKARHIEEGAYLKENIGYHFAEALGAPHNTSYADTAFLKAASGYFGDYLTTGKSQGRQKISGAERVER